MYRNRTLLYLCVGIGVLFIPGWITSAAQVEDSVEMPEEARRLFAREELKSIQLSELGQRAVLASFSARFHEKVVLIELDARYKDCQKSSESRDCEKEYLALYEGGKKQEAFLRQKNNDYVTWKSSWLTRMDIPNLPDAVQGTVELKEDAEKEFALYEKWCEANGYPVRKAQIEGNRQAEIENVRMLGPGENESLHAKSMALIELRYEWAGFSLDEEYMCKYLLNVLGKNPAECMAWRSKGLEVEDKAVPPENLPEVTVIVYPEQFLEPGDTVNINVGVVEKDGTVISGTSVHLVQEGYPDDAQEYLTDGSGVVRIPVQHKDESKVMYRFTLYTRGISRQIEIPVLTREMLRRELESVPAGESKIMYQDDIKESEIALTRNESDWSFRVVIQEAWSNREHIADLLKNLGFSPAGNRPDEATYVCAVQDKESAVDILIKTRKILAEALLKQGA